MSGCGIFNDPTKLGSARLTVRPGPPTTVATPGTLQLGKGLLLIPESYTHSVPMPLMVALHGGGGRATDSISFLGPYAEANGFLLLAADSHRSTWDGILGPFGPDVSNIDDLMERTFDRCAVDFTRIALEGFSDGAGEALGLGLANGDLFTHLIANSPGFIAPSDSPDIGSPKIFISHGREDGIISFDTTNEQIVPYLRQLGYSTVFVPFDGGHTVPADVASGAVNWFLNGTVPELSVRCPECAPSGSI